MLDMLEVPEISQERSREGIILFQGVPKNVKIKKSQNKQKL